VLLTGLTGASPWWVVLGERSDVFPVVQCCCCFEFGSFWSSEGWFGFLGLPGFDRSDRRPTPA
jgi:hypothetical protein